MWLCQAWGAADQDDRGLQSMAAGRYTLKAVATDDSGAAGEATVSLTVSGGRSRDGERLRCRRRD